MASRAAALLLGALWWSSFSAHGQSAAVASWNFTGRGGSTSVGGSPAGGVASAAASLGPGLTAINYLSNGLTGTGAASGNLAAAIAANDYIRVVVTPQSGKPLSIDALKIRLVSQNARRSFAVLSSVRGFAADKVLGTITGAAGLNDALQTVLISNHQNLTSAVEFRIYVYEAPNPHEAVGLGNRRAGLSEDDLQLIGRVGNTGTGLRAAYFNSVNLGGAAVLTRTDATVDFAWGTASPGAGVAADNFSARWTGQVEAPASGAYTFTTTSDDGVRLWVNGQPLVNNWTDHAPTDNSGTITLAAGRRYDVVLEYYDRSRDATAKLAWAYPGQASAQVVPAGRLYPVPLAGRGVAQGTGVANQLGININHASYYSTDRPYADMMKMTDTWDTPNRDARGWPNEDASVLVWQDVDQMHGTYRLSYTGQGNVSVQLGPATIQNKTYNAATNTTTADVVYTHADKNLLRLRFTGIGGGAKNIRLLRPKTPGGTEPCAPTDIFYQPFRDMASRFRVIRFMDFRATNGNGDVNWTDAVPATYATYGPGGNPNYGWQGKGAPWWAIVEMANALQKDAWICIPHKATDAYVTQVARVFKFGCDANGVPYTSAQANPAFPPLSPNLKLYVEYSNELWNFAPAFTQGGWNKDQALAEVAAGNSPLNYDNYTNDFHLGFRRVAKRAIEISKSFRAVFGDGDMMTRVRPVLMWQQANGQSTADQMLSFAYDYYSNGDGKTHVSDPRPLSYYLYAGGGSAYYDPNNAADDLTLDNIWNRETFDVAHWRPNLRRDATWATTFGLRYMAYEGGPGLDRLGHSEAVKALAWADARMKNEVLEHHEAWSNHGGDLLCYFNTTGDYQWGFARDVLDPNTPKFEAVDVLRNTPEAPITLGDAAPYEKDGRAFDAARVIWKQPGTGAQAVPTGEWFAYLFRVTTPGDYTVSIRYANAGNATATFRLDGRALGNRSFQGSGQFTAPFTMPGLQPGLHAVLVQAAAGTFDIARVKIGAAVTTSRAAATAGQPGAAKPAEALELYPVPATGEVTVTLPASSAAPVTRLTVTNSLGEVVLSEAVEQAPGQPRTLRLSLRTLPPGLYFVGATHRGGTQQVRKLLVEH